MIRLQKILLCLVLSTLVFSFNLMYFAKELDASEGMAELRSTTNESYRCFAYSMINEKGQFTILMSCRDLLYPQGSYVTWANTLSGKTLKLGTLDYGRRTFFSKEAFSDLFVSLEGSAGVREPTGSVVMKGTVQPVTFLEQVTTPTPTQEKEKAQEEDKQSETDQLSTKDKLLMALRRAGIAALLALVAIIGLVFVITRSRG